jgi:hypothetical protein
MQRTSILGYITGKFIRAHEATMAVKVFVSSTYVDLKEYRQRVITQLRRAGYQVDPMEDWTSDTDEPRRFSLDRLDGCQACILLVGFRRGFVPSGHVRSITQMEYDHAIARGIAVFPFLLHDGVTGWAEPYDDRAKDPLLKEWCEYLGLHHGIEQFTAEPTSIDGSATQVMLAVRFHATVGQTQTQTLGGQQQPWSSETRAQRMERIGTRKMAIPAMANRIINAKRASDSLWPLPKTVSLQAGNVP